MPFGLFYEALEAPRYTHAERFAEVKCPMAQCAAIVMPRV